MGRGGYSTASPSLCMVPGAPNPSLTSALAELNLAPGVDPALAVSRRSLPHNMNEHIGSLRPKHEFKKIGKQ